MRRVLGLDVVINAYGLTESTALVSTSRPGDDPLLVATTVGRAAEGLEVKAVDESGSDVRPGEAGEILVRGYTVMRGYWNDDVSTGEAITTDGFLKTGDIGVIDENGFIRITDRKKDLFIVGGFNAYPAEIEAALLRFEKILHVAVIGVPDDRMGEVGWAYVVPKIGEQITERDVIEFARRSLANFKVPRRVIFLQELPRTPSLKVTKVPLKQAALAELRAEGS
jgi:acyl-CoA synthetase (AMP-forming)/AMP-acid ligase II